MNAVRQKCRPKHQVLVLKCYPRFQKGVQDVKPNSSELSYLLYYATTRRSKLQKVGAFLERKTASDVWRNRLGNVQVTLQILTALIEKAPRDLPLYAGWVLTILDTVVRSKDINMIEESLGTFEMFCKHQDLSAATQIAERSSKYQDIVKAYATFASDEFQEQQKPPLSKPMIIRWKTLGLRAIKAVVDSEGFGADSGKQLSMVLPIILENLYSEEGDIFSLLQQKAQNAERLEIELVRKRGMSTNTATTVDTLDNPLTAASTTADADKVAEEEFRLLAIRSLKQIFSAAYGTNRGYIRLATTVTLKFIATKKPTELPIHGSRHSVREGNWATSLVETVTRWTPVQDRFIIVITTMENLTRSPIVEANLPTQLTLAEILDWLLGSTINMIGLSVMDVLLGFVQHILLLLQLDGRGSVVPHQQQSLGIDLYKDANAAFGIASTQEEAERGRSEKGVSSTPSSARQNLLLRLQKCIGDLATHIYYTDQISDMILSVLARLKPSLNSDVPSTAAAIENPAAAANTIANSANLQEDPTTDGFFSFANARVTALKAVKDILIVANLRKSTAGPVAEARSRVGLNVWEGTQWLLRDEDSNVRVAYVDALLTWLKLETTKNDLQIVRETSRRVKSDSKRDAPDELKLAKRAVSNASRSEKLRKVEKSKFLQLLHLAVYENALERPEDESNILLLHLLLSHGLERLGVNAARYGLPMIFRLQDDLAESDVISGSKALISVGSLVHGYFGALSEKFDIEASRVGAEIHGEISNRRKKGLWLDTIRFPPMPLDQFPDQPTTLDNQKIPEVTPDSLKPFTNRAELVDEISKAYESLSSPQNSPPTSPGRVFSVPSLGFGYGYGNVSNARPAPEDQLPEKVKEELLAEWTKANCIATVERDSAQASSITGSKKTGTDSMGLNQLGVTNGIHSNGQLSGTNSGMIHGDKHHHHGHHSRPVSRPASTAYGLVGGMASLHNLRKTSGQEGSPTPLTPSSSRDSTVRVNELKRVLSVNRTRHASPLRYRPKSGYSASVASTDTESMVSYSDADGGDASMIDLNQDQGDQTKNSTTNRKESSRPSSRYQNNDDIPPVPKIPSSLNLPGEYPADASPSETSEAPQEANPESQRGNTNDREGRSVRRGKSRPVSRKEKAIELNAWASEKASLFNHRADLGKLLAGIEPGLGEPPSGEQRAVSGGLSTPPY